MELVFYCHDCTKEKKVLLAVTGFCGYALTWWDRNCKTRRFKGEPQVSSWFELKAIMKKRFVSRSFGQPDLSRNHSLSSSSRRFNPQLSSSKTFHSSHDSGSTDVKENKPKEENPWSNSKLLEIMRLSRERTELEKNSDQEDKAEQTEQSDHEEVTQIQGVELPTTMVKVQHELILHSEEIQQEEVDSKVEMHQERKEATIENLLQNKTRSICDELSKRYFLQPGPYVPYFELMKEVEYGKHKLCESLSRYEF